MKPKHSLRSFLAVAGSTLIFSMQAQAAMYYWDTNTTTGGLGNTAGTWGAGVAGSAFLSTIAGNGLARSFIDGTQSPTASNATASGDIIYFGTVNLGLGGTGSSISIASGGVNISTIVFSAGQGAQGVTLNGGGGTITLGTAPSIVANNTGVNTIGAVLTGSAGMTMVGPGTVKLTGANTYTGTTTVQGGGTLQVGDGTSGNLFNTTPSALTFSAGGGTINFNEAAGSTQSMGALTFSAGEGIVQSTYAGSGSSALGFASLAARTAGASGNLVTSGGTNGTTNKITITGASTGALLDRGLFFNGSSYAAYDGTGFVRAYGVGDTNYLAAPTGSTMGSPTNSSNVELTTGNITAQTAASANTINMGANSITMTGTSTLLQTNGLLSSGSGSATIGGGTTPLLQTATASGEMVVRVNGSSDKLTISSGIQNNTSASALTKSGAGTLVLSGANTYTGTTTINSGILALSGGSAIANTGAVVLANAAGATLRLDSNETIGNVTGGGFSGGNVNVQGNTLTIAAASGTFSGQFTGTGSGQIIKQGAGTLTLNNPNSFAGTITVSAGTLQFTMGNTATGSVAQVSSGGAINLANGTTLNSSPTVQYNLGQIGNQGNNAYPYPFAYTIGNAINVTSGTANMTFLNLNDTKWNFTGDVTGSSSPSTPTTLAVTIPSGVGRQDILFSGILKDGTGGALGLSASLAGSSSGNNLNLSGLNTFTGPITVSNSTAFMGYVGIGGERGGQGITLGSGYIGSGNYTNTISLVNATVTLDYLSSANQTLGGVISGAGAILKEGSGTLTLSASNSYTGTTTIGAGTLSINSIASVSGGNSAVGAPTSAAAGTIGIGSTTSAGQLTYTGATATTDRVINLAGTTGGATIDQSGSGLLKFTSALTATGSGAKTLTLQGSTSGSGEIAGAIVNSASATSLAKSGTGTWTLSGANTYTGATTINAGTLQFAKQTALYNNTTASWTAANINVKSSGILGLNLGGTGEFTTGNITTLLSNLAASSSATNGMNAGSGFAFDTTNASGGTFTIADVIADSTGASGGARSLTKLGSNTLILSNTNIYTGATTVTAGTLQVDGSTSASSTVNIGTNGTLTGSGTINGAVNVTGNGVINKSSGAIAGNLGVTGGNWNGNGTVSGTVTSSSGTFTIGSGANLTATGGVAITGGTLVAGSGSSTITGNLNYTSGANSTFAGVVAGSGNTLTMNNAAAKLILTGTNTYTGATTVSAGALAVNGSLANTATTVGNTGTLQGSGIIGGSVTIQSGGTLAPGNSIESLGTGALSFEADSTYAYELQTNLYAGTPGVAGDLIYSSGTLDIQAGSILTLTDLAASTALAAGSKLTLISYFGGWTGVELFSYDAGAGLATLADGATFTLGANQWRFDYNDITGGPNFGSDQTGATAFVTMTVVPEPGAALIGSLSVLALLRRRRHG